MLTKTAARLRLARQGDEEQGFTLIELMVVVLIIAILIAIAIPTFLGARNKANDRAAQSSLRNALTAAKTSFTDTGDYSGATPAGLAAIEPSLTFQTTASTGFKQVAVIAAPSGQKFWAVVKSQSGKCYGIEDSSGTGGAGTTYAGTTTVIAPTAGNCAVTAGDPAYPDTKW